MHDCLYKNSLFDSYLESNEPITMLFLSVYGICKNIIIVLQLAITMVVCIRYYESDHFVQYYGSL